MKIETNNSKHEYIAIGPPPPPVLILYSLSKYLYEIQKKSRLEGSRRPTKGS
jgi:hypothetical protein